MLNRPYEKAIEMLEEAKNQEPELASFYHFYQDIFRLQHEAGANIHGELELTDKDILEEKASQGQPLISFVHLPVEPDSFGQLAAEITRKILDFQRIEQSEYPLEGLDWVDLARSGFEEASREDESEPSEIAANLALFPYLEWSASQIMPHLAKIVWKKGWCPVCGGEPGFAFLETEEGGRRLVCSRCHAEWPFARLKCPFCEESAPEKLKYFPAGRMKTYRLYVCDSCHRYLKAIDLRKTIKEISLIAEPVLTWSLDRAAREMGYR